jgi:hypothetical protein
MTAKQLWAYREPIAIIGMFSVAILLLAIGFIVPDPELNFREFMRENPPPAMNE